MTHEKFKTMFDEMMSACAEIDAVHTPTNKTQTKAVLCSVLSTYHSSRYIAPYLNLTRTAVCYHNRQHPKNISYWVGYENKYVKCKQIYAKYASCDLCKGRGRITIMRIDDTETISCPICQTDSK